MGRNGFDRSHGRWLAWSGRANRPSQRSVFDSRTIGEPGTRLTRPATERLSSWPSSGPSVPSPRHMVYGSPSSPAITGARGVAFFGVDANQQDGPVAIGRFAERHGLPFPMLKDVGTNLADRIGAERTPEVFVLDVS